MKIICDDKIPFLKGVFEPYAQVVYLPGQEISPADVKDADALITRTRTACNRALLDGSTVRIIATATIGYDHIDTAWCESAGIEWTNAPGCNSSSVQQYIASVLCTLAERFKLQFKDITLGVVGVGHVGCKVAAAARALGMNVLLCDPPRARKASVEQSGQYETFVSLDEIVRNSDIITLHVPLTKDGPDATRHLFDSARIASLHPEQILINTSRGAVVDNQALKTALKTGSVRAAVLDVWENEPEIDTELLDLLSIATPHIAGYSADGKANGTAAAVQAVARRLGLPLNDWQPADIPDSPQEMCFSIDVRGKTTQDIISEAVLRSYSIENDDYRLRSNPHYFEKLRENYPVRRDFSAYSLKLHGNSPETASALGDLGFHIQ